jgi:endonuclease YncB( thermonuclease family)
LGLERKEKLVMPFTLIKGTFHVVGYSPDGDSIRFQARDNANWNKLGGPPVSLNGRNHAQLRLEAIDTLETHYQGSHQPLELALAALNSLMDNLNIENLMWNPSHTMVTSASDGVDGYILSREVEPNHRPVSFAFAGDTERADGSEVYLEKPLLKESVNYKQLAAGMAYPTYYRGLFSDLRKALTEAAQNARSAGLGIWPQDKTETGAPISGLQSIEEDHLLLPKLFRRLAEHLEGGGSIDGFKNFLASKQEKIIIIPTVHPTHFDTVVEIDGNVVKLTFPPESIMFDP